MLPVGPSSPGRTAVRTLEVVRPALFVLPHREAAWKILKERLNALADACAGLAADPQLTALAAIGTTLRAYADEFGHHIEARAAAQPH